MSKKEISAPRPFGLLQPYPPPQSALPHNEKGSGGDPGGEGDPMAQCEGHHSTTDHSTAGGTSLPSLPHTDSIAHTLVDVVPVVPLHNIDWGTVGCVIFLVGEPD